MSSIVTHSLGRRGQDHFEPEAQLDPQEQRRMRGHLDQIDYTAFAANREILAKALGVADLGKFQRMAVAAAHARAQWVAAGIAMSESGHPPSPAQIAELHHLRQAFEELTEVYEAMRRMIERGYVHYQAKA
jgi:hypothetical protein